MHVVNWYFVADPLILVLIICIENVGVEHFEVDAHTICVQIQTKLARVRGWTHYYLDAVYIIPLLLDEVSIAETTKHHVGHELQVKCLPLEVGHHSQVALCLIVQQLCFTQTTVLGGIGKLI